MKFDKKTTIYDVAEMAKVSLATVSRVLNTPEKVRPDTVKKVEQAISKLNYHPDEIARGLVTKKSTTIGILFPSATNPFFSELMHGINDVSQIFDYNIFFASTDENFGLSSIELVEKLLTRKIDGLILSADQFNNQLKKIIENADVPYVILSGLIDNKSKIHQVSIDIISALTEAVNYLDDYQVAFLDYRSEEKDHQKIAEAFTGSTINLLQTGTFQAGYDAFESVKEYDAVIASNDQIAAGLLASALDHKIKVPNNFQIISLQDSEFSTMIRPQISSISFSKYDIGAISMRMLTKLMNNEQLDSNQIVIPHQLIQRGTTK